MKHNTRLSSLSRGELKKQRTNIICARNQNNKHKILKVCPQNQILRNKMKVSGKGLKADLGGRLYPETINFQQFLEIVQERQNGFLETVQ